MYFEIPSVKTTHEIDQENHYLQELLRKVKDEIARQLRPQIAAIDDANNIHRLIGNVARVGDSGIKPRNKEYIREKIRNFIVIKDGRIIVACAELIPMAPGVIELGALATHPNYQKQGMSDKILEYAEDEAERTNQNLILVTDNPILIRALMRRCYSEASLAYPERSAKSPNKRIYLFGDLQKNYFMRRSGGNYSKTIPTGQGSDPIISGGIVASVMRGVRAPELRK